MECDQIGSLVKTNKKQRSTNNSKSSELFNLDVSKRIKTETNELILTYDFSDSLIYEDENSSLLLVDKKTRSKQISLDKKRLALEKRLARQKEKEAKRLQREQKEQMRKLRQEHKAKYNNKCKTNLVLNSDSTTSLANNFDQFLIYKPKSVLFNQSQVSSFNTFPTNTFNGSLNVNCNTMRPFDDNYQYNDTSFFNTRLEPFRVNSTHLVMNSLNETTHFINYDFNARSVDEATNSNSVHCNDYLMENTCDLSSNLESITNDNSFLTYENLDDINYSLLTDFDISVDLIKQDLTLF